MRPNRNKMAVLSWVTIYPLITLILWVSQPLTRHLPLYTTTLMISLFLTAIMNYVAMPLMTRAFGRWLRPTPTTSRDHVHRSGGQQGRGAELSRRGACGR